MVELISRMPAAMEELISRMVIASGPVDFHCWFSSFGHLLLIFLALPLTSLLLTALTQRCGVVIAKRMGRIPNLFHFSQTLESCIGLKRG